jgi:biopolymer transport protein ExbB/TolQ
MEIHLAELWTSMGWPVRSVVIVLTLQAVACMAVVLDRLVALTQAKARARTFATEVAQPMSRGDYERVLAVMAAAKPNPLTSYLESALSTFVARINQGDDARRAAELATRELARRGEVVGYELNRGMNVLASTGSTAPFVGLLGTVLGIINAFKMIAATGAGGIGTIGASIGEALVVTGYGLVVAIPSVLVFNWLSGQIAVYERRLINSGSEFIDRLETGGVGTLQRERSSAKPDAFVAAPVSTT